MRATFDVQGAKLSDSDVYDRFVGSMPPDAEVAEWADGLTAELLNDMCDHDDPYTDEDADEVRAAIAQYVARQ